jgi:hypothetical protein
MLTLALLTVVLAALASLLSLVAIMVLRFHTRTCHHGTSVRTECAACREEASDRVRRQIEEILGGPVDRDGTIIGSALCSVCGEEVLFGGGRSAKQVVCRNGHVIVSAGSPRYRDQGRLTSRVAG